MNALIEHLQQAGTFHLSYLGQARRGPIHLVVGLGGFHTQPALPGAHLSQLLESLGDRVEGMAHAFVGDACIALCQLSQVG